MLCLLSTSPTDRNHPDPRGLLCLLQLPCTRSATNQHNHYSAPIIHNYRRNVHSCDDLTDNAEKQPLRSQHYAQQYAQHYNSAASQHYQRQASTGMCSRKPRNLLDMIPPPPVHPPPTAPSSGGIYNKSQESVISPKYLFAHPMYQGTTNNYKVHPSHAGSNI